MLYTACSPVPRASAASLPRCQPALLALTPGRYVEMKRTKDEGLVADVHSLSAGLKAYTTSYTNSALRWGPPAGCQPTPSLRRTGRRTAGASSQCGA